MTNKINIKKHLRCFVNSFVKKDKQERWEHFLCNRPKQVYSNSSKLLNHLDSRYYIEINNLSSCEIPLNAMGVFYDFSYEPEVITFKEACEEGINQDAIFSYNEGSLAIYFFHEGSIYLCKKANNKAL